MAHRARVFATGDRKWYNRRLPWRHVSTMTTGTMAVKRRFLEKGRVVNAFLPYVQVIQIIISIALIAIILAQAKGQGGLGGIFGGDATVYHTRRGVEKTLFNITIVLAVLFFITSLISVLVA